MLVVDLLARQEPLELSDDQVEPTVQELAAAVRAIRSMLEFTDAMRTVVSRHAERLGLPSREPSPKMAEARSKTDVHAELLRRLQRPLLRLLDQLESRRPSGVPPLNLEPSPLAPEPDTKPGPSQILYVDIRAVEKWVGTGMGRHARELKRTLTAVHKRSGAWNGPAGHQLHSDTGRLLSRI